MTPFFLTNFVLRLTYTVSYVFRHKPKEKIFRTKKRTGKTKWDEGYSTRKFICVCVGKHKYISLDERFYLHNCYIPDPVDYGKLGVLHN